MELDESMHEYMDIERVKINARYQPRSTRASHRCAGYIAHIQGRAELSYIFPEEINLILFQFNSILTIS